VGNAALTTRLVINWLIPEPFPGAGGDTGLFRIIRYLAEFGHECHVYVVPYNLMNDFTTEQIRQYVRKHFGATTARYHRWNGNIGDADATFATFWPTVENLLPLSNGGRRYYLVQDFEPSFYPDDRHNYARAENTYRAGFHCVTLGPWLAKLLRERYQATADHFDFAVDTDIYWPRPALRDAGRRLCFYARPATPRRAYGLGLEALQLVKERLPAVEIVLFGTQDLTPEPPFHFINRGLVSQDDLARLFCSCDVGLVISLTNPSFVSLEMMACRCAVVEIASERFEGVLTHGQNAWLVEPTATEIADGIVELLEDTKLRERIVENAYQRTRTMHWRDSVRQIEAILLRTAKPSSEKRKTRGSFLPRVWSFLRAWLTPRPATQHRPGALFC
jgi:glycosyltransferase involved in cell wall biosynthesis